MNIDITKATAAQIEQMRPDLAKAFRDEGIASVKADEQVSNAVKALEEKHAVALATAKAEGATEERKRISSIRANALAGSEALVATAIEKGHTVEQFAVDQIGALKKGEIKADPKAALNAAETVASQVTATPGAADDKNPNPQAKATADVSVLKAAGVIR